MLNGVTPMETQRLRRHQLLNGALKARASVIELIARYERMLDQDREPAELTR